MSNVNLSPNEVLHQPCNDYDADSNFSKCITELQFLNSHLLNPTFVVNVPTNEDGKPLGSLCSLNLPVLSRLRSKDADQVDFAGARDVAVAGETDAKEGLALTCLPSMACRSYIDEYKTSKYLDTGRMKDTGALADRSAHPLQKKSFPPVTWLQYETPPWQKNVKAPPATKKKMKRVMWKPSKATLIFSEQCCANFPERHFGRDACLEEDESSFPTEHKLATSEDLRRAMKFVKTREQMYDQNRTRKNISFLTMSREMFSKTHNSLSLKSRMELQLKYRQIMSRLKRQEYLQWECEAMARSGHTDKDQLQQPFENTSGRFMPFQSSRDLGRPGRFKSKVCRYKNSPGRARVALVHPTESRHTTLIHRTEATKKLSACSLSKQLSPTPTVRLIKCNQFNQLSPVSSNTLIKCNQFIQASPVSSNRLVTCNESIQASPLPVTPNIVQAQRSPQYELGDVDIVPPECPGEAGQHGDGPSTITSDDPCQSVTTEALMRKKAQNSCVTSNPPGDTEVDSTKHPERCSCRSCVKTAEWINSIVVPSLKSLDLTSDGGVSSRVMFSLPYTLDGGDSVTGEECQEEIHDATSDMVKISEYSSLAQD
ncbi:uncharacterized protein LOC106051208 [Biomphalaria glabrata]|uniref:Uncharacterized protein LOC106051208 n=1 Tax=Biomphalaria glabrata TaxID=6526 RepID=A0A9U8DVP2_BIOGL|nr:uncharacterized protein LOC106051208 [Biomphalaria glabrata]